MTQDPVENWLSTCGDRTRAIYASYFPRFLDFMQKDGKQMLAEARKNQFDPEKSDFYPQKIFEFYRFLLSGKVKAMKAGSVKGKHGGGSKEYSDKPLAQLTAACAVNSVKSFFSFHNLPMNTRKFFRKDVRMKSPKVLQKKRELTSPEIDMLMRLASPRDRCILALGFAAGQDESTIASLRWEQFYGKLSGKQLEFIEGVLRQKSNEEILIILTRELQTLLAEYFCTLGGEEKGWVFKGYRGNKITNAWPNSILKNLAKKAGIANNGKRLSFHAARMWFSTQLRSKVSDDIIDKLTGHKPRFGGAYLGDSAIQEQLRESNIEELLRLQQSKLNGNGAAIKKELLDQKATIQTLITEMTDMRETYEKSIEELRAELAAHEVPREQEEQAVKDYEKQIQQEAEKLVFPLREQIKELQKKFAESQKKK